jgi:hypothetical protein
VLFSREPVANFINTYFEPAWEMVRPVPIFRLDFGNNNVITRTLHGNIATYVCSSNGEVLDALPGIYTPAAYVDNLNQFRLLAKYVDRQGKDKRQEVVKDYHKKQAEALTNNQAPLMLVNSAGRSKAVIERTVAVLVAAKESHLYPSMEDRALSAKGGLIKEPPHLDSKDESANWNLLSEDTRLNETIRRRLIHEMLANAGLVKPDEVKKRIYKEVLHADLEDPYLGLGNLLFANYPFAREDKAP